MASLVVATRMPSLCEVVPAGLELAHLVDAAGGLAAAAGLLGTGPETLAGWLTGQVGTALLPLATRRLAARLGSAAGWSAPAEGLRVVA
jgi:hypothetical protein